MIDIAINDDYAVLTTTNYGFYYGYEYDFEEDKYGDTHDEIRKLRIEVNRLKNK